MLANCSRFAATQYENCELTHGKVCVLIFVVAHPTKDYIYFQKISAWMLLAMHKRQEYDNTQRNDNLLSQPTCSNQDTYWTS